MKVITAPMMAVNESPSTSVFLAGGITGCPDWRKEAISYFKNPRLNLFNPRRLDFDLTNPLMTEEQIRWEFVHLRHCQNIMFWFPKESICPITLFELGYQMANSDVKRRIVVGADPQYPRFSDLVTQLGLLKYHRIYTTLAETVQAIETEVFLWSAPLEF